MTGLARTEGFLVQRELPGSPERVFEWLTDATKLARWMSPAGEVIAEAEASPGGGLRIVMVGEGMRIEHTGVFLEVVRPRRLVFTWNSPYTDGDSLVTIELEARGDRTAVTLRHERLPQQHADAHMGGWASMLDRLALEMGDGDAT